MDNKDLEKFDPTVAELTAMVESTKNITATDLKDREQLEVVRTARISLKNARVNITKIGKELREDALKFQKAVITKEKELIGIIEPEEERLEAIEEEAKQLYIREERLKLLPTRKERLLEIDGVTEWATDEELLALNSEQYEAFFNECTAKHNEAVRLAEEARIAKEREEAEAKLEAERKAFEEEKRLEAEKREAEAKAKAEAEAKAKADKAEADAKEEAKRKAEQDKIDEEKRKIEAEKLAIKHAQEVKEAEEKARKEAEAKAKADAEAKAKADKAEADAKAKAEAQEKAKLEKRKAFIAFREKHGYTEETKDDFITKETEEGYVLFKKVGVFNK